MRRPVLAIAAVLACAVALPAAAQDLSRACPKANEVTWEHLLGTWRAEVQGHGTSVLVLQRHPELAESVRGTIDRDGARLEVAGDVEDGDLTLEESANGVNISATWLGDVVEGSCGREVRGAWTSEASPIEFPFVMKKQ